MKEYKVRYKPNGYFVRATSGNVWWTARCLNEILLTKSMMSIDSFLSEKAGRRYPQKRWAEKFILLLDESIRDKFKVVEFDLIESI